MNPLAGIALAHPAFARLEAAVESAQLELAQCRAQLADLEMRLGVSLACEKLSIRPPGVSVETLKTQRAQLRAQCEAAELLLVGFRVIATERARAIGDAK